ncbi:MAG: threonine/serine dehydratase [Oscillospiraceae bacterium]|nr:threonine/serine dehydratase [Oscillospiraceae bacterium]
MIRSAGERIRPYIVTTPLIRTPQLDEELRCVSFMKAETMQVTNSFKIRGAMNRILTLTREERNAGVVTASSGNFGKAVAYAAARLGIEAHIVLPDTAPKNKTESIRAYGAELVISTLAERFETAAGLSREKGWTLLTPFDDYEIMAGQGTAGAEIIEQLPETGRIVIPVGGGGLLGGVAAAVKSMRPDVKIIGAEPAAAARYTRSIEAGRPVVLPRSTRSVADGLQTLSPGRLNYPIVRAFVDEIVTVDEEYIIRALCLLTEKGKLIAEPSAAVPVAAALQGSLGPDENGNTVFLLSGGNTDLRQLEAMLSAAPVEREG